MIGEILKGMCLYEKLHVYLSIYTSENVCMKCIQEKVPYKAYPCFKKINHTFVHKICQV